MLRSSIIFRDSFSHLPLTPASRLAPVSLWQRSSSVFNIRLSSVSVDPPDPKQPSSIHCDSQVYSFLFAQIQITDNACNTPFLFVTPSVLCRLWHVNKTTRYHNKSYEEEFRWKQWLSFYRQKTRYMKRESIDNGNKAGSMKGILPLRWFEIFPATAHIRSQV